MAVESSVYSRFADAPVYKIWPGIVAHAIRGEKVMVALVELEPDTEVAEHSHPQEQAGFIIEGTFTFTIGGETRRLGPGDTYVIPGGVPHSAKSGPEGNVVIDVFSPPREDWDRLEQEAPRPARWPR